VKIKSRITVQGTVMNDERGVSRGQVVDWPKEVAEAWIENGFAQADWKAEPGPAYQPSEQRSMTRWTRS
jgi:hypothetical protein